MAEDALNLSAPLVESFGEVQKQLEEKVHLLATDGDERLSQVALQITKQLFDLGVQLETESHPHVHPFLASISQPTGIELRSSKKSSATDKALERVKPDDVLPHTPLSELTTEGLEPEQIWQQMELRTPGYVRVSKELTTSDEPMGMDEVDLEHSEDGSGSEEEDMTEEEFREMLAEQGMDDLTEEEIAKMLQDAEDEGDSDEDDEDDEDEDEDEDDSDEEEEEEDNEEEMSGSDEEDEVMFEDGTKIGGSDEDEDDLDLDLDDEEDDSEGSGDEDDEEDGDEDMLDEDEEASGSDAGSADSADEDLPGPSRAGPSKRRQHPTLDDQFFSIDDFNRMTEEAEASHLSSGRLNEDEEEDLDEDVGDMMLRGANEDDPIMYGDFFDAPRTVQKPVGKAKSKPDVKGKGKGKGRKARFEVEEDEEEEQASDEEDDEAREVMGRFKEDLFADDDEEEAQPEAALSTHEKRQRALADQIAQLEQEAVGPKDWTLLGEASARARPENSLLEEDLDFEHVQKVTPVITEETVRTLEELIKKRILDNDFNSTVRVRAYEPTPFLPSRYFDLQDTQSSKSLAQIYEEEYQSAAAGGKASDPRDEKLKKEHQEIEDLWGEICYKLDALSSLNFVPKQPKAQITTISNLPTTSMETALPATSSTSTMLAPEELFQPATQSSLVARSELTPEEAQRMRERKRKAKKQERKHLGDMAELYGKSKNAGGGGVKGEKERALQGLVKSGKGVTVIGKGDKEMGKARKRDSGDGDEAREDGKRLKL